MDLLQLIKLKLNLNLWLFIKTLFLTINELAIDFIETKIFFSCRHLTEVDEAYHPIQLDDYCRPTLNMIGKALQCCNINRNPIEEWLNNWGCTTERNIDTAV